MVPGSRFRTAELEAGDELTEGSVNPHDILKIKGLRAVQDYMIQEVQRVYRLQGVEINDKHIEVIVRQMLKKIRIEEAGDTEFLPGTNVDRLIFEDVNNELEKREKSLQPESRSCLVLPRPLWQPTPSCQPHPSRRPRRFLRKQRSRAKVDPLIGLKENVIIGKHIPAGTGMRKYRDIKFGYGVIPG